MGLREKEVRTTLAVPECPVCKNGDMIFNKKGFLGRVYFLINFNFFNFSDTLKQWDVSWITMRNWFALRALSINS